MFDTTAYERVRSKYHAEGKPMQSASRQLLKVLYFCTGAFPHLYDKTKPEIDVVAVGKAYMDPLDA